MDLTGAFPPAILSLGVIILGATFGTVFALSQAGLPAKWSYLAAIGVGALWGLLLGGTQFGASPMLFSAIVFGALTGLGTQTASRRPAEKIVVEGAAKLGETQIPTVIVTQPTVEVIPPLNPPDVSKG